MQCFEAFLFLFLAMLPQWVEWFICLYGWLVGCGQLQNFDNLITSKKFQNKCILGNSEQLSSFWPQTLPSKTHKLGLKFFVQICCLNFCSIFIDFFSSINKNLVYQNKKSSKFKIISTKIDFRRLLPCLWPLILSYFKNSQTKMCFRPFWASLIFWP